MGIPYGSGHGLDGPGSSHVFVVCLCHGSGQVVFRSTLVHVHDCCTEDMLISKRIPLATIKVLLLRQLEVITFDLLLLRSAWTGKLNAFWLAVWRSWFYEALHDAVGFVSNNICCV